MRTSSDMSLEAELKGGKYGVVRSLLRVLEGGTASKALLDTVIDACKYAFQPFLESVLEAAGLCGWHCQAVPATTAEHPCTISETVGFGAADLWCGE